MSKAESAAVPSITGLLDRTRELIVDASGPITSGPSIYWCILRCTRQCWQPIARAPPWPSHSLRVFGGELAGCGGDSVQVALYRLDFNSLATPRPLGEGW